MEIKATIYLIAGKVGKHPSIQHDSLRLIQSERSDFKENNTIITSIISVV